MTEFRIGQRVKFENPDPPIAESQRNISNTYLRGRITYLNAPGSSLIQVIPDGKTFALWLDLQKTEVLSE